MTKMPQCHYCEKSAWYQDRSTGEFLCPEHARLEVRGPSPDAQKSQIKFVVRPASDTEQSDILTIWNHFWYDDEMDSFEKEYRAVDLPALIAWSDDRIAGLLSYSVERDTRTINIVALNVLPDFQSCGIGNKLIKTLEDVARAENINRLLVATANDNALALYFYQRLGFVLTNILYDVILPDDADDDDDMVGLAGIPVRDEIQLEKIL